MCKILEALVSVSLVLVDGIQVKCISGVGRIETSNASKSKSISGVGRMETSNVSKCISCVGRMETRRDSDCKLPAGDISTGSRSTPRARARFEGD